MIRDFFSLVFPDTCQICSDALVSGEELLCTRCIVELPQAQLHRQPEHPLLRGLHLKAGIAHVLPYLKFVKKGPAQRLIHKLKYADRPEVAEVMGRWFGQSLKNDGFDGSFDLILPVPLHPKKLSKRGYNQSEGFAKGLAEALATSFSPDILIRQKNTRTQTKLSRWQRWENVAEVFAVSMPDEVSGKNLLIVDDVITTGATMEACAVVCRQAGCRSVSLGAIAYTL